VARLALQAQRPDWRLSSAQWKVLRALAVCRTPALGGHRYECRRCGREHFVPHSCRNRHCPACQGAQAFDWLARQEAVLLPIPYFHLVFTLPHALHPLIRQNRRALFNLLFDAANQTLLAFGRQRLGAQLGVTAVLHTWGQTLCEHYHLHGIVTGGGLSLQGSGWKHSPAHYLFPVRALSQMFRGKFCAGLQRLHQRQALAFHGPLQPLIQPRAFAGLVQEARQRPWVIYAKRPFAGPSQVLAYLSRYTHRVALGNGRLLQVDAQRVTFRYKDYANQSRPKIMTLSLAEFVRRFCLHVLPERFVKIRHYGLVSNRDRQERLARAHQALAVVPPAPTPSDPKPAPSQRQRRCPFCGALTLVLVEAVPALRPLNSVIRCDSS
jgi:hypothetical protein